MSDLLMRTIFDIVGDKNHILEAAVADHISSRLVSRDCSNCGFEGDVEEVTDLGGSRWECPECDEPHDGTEDHDYDDPDADRDRWLEDIN